jgi:hypothetical protein
MGLRVRGKRIIHRADAKKQYGISRNADAARRLKVIGAAWILPHHV